jgi:hypothetical protein
MVTLSIGQFVHMQLNVVWLTISPLIPDITPSVAHPEESKESEKEREEEGSIVILNYLKVTLSSTDVSRLGGSIPNDSRVRIVAAELKFVVSPACSSRDIIYLYMVLQPFVRNWPLFTFLILYTVGMTHWTGDQPVARPLHTHTGRHKQNKRKLTSVLQVGFEPTIPVFERAKTVHALDREDT